MADVQRSIVGQLPFVLESDVEQPLVFALRVTPEALPTFARRCLVFHSVEFTLQDGSRHVARFGGKDALGGVQLQRPPPDYRECP